jgi:UDP-GlcNAc:undecaprenyl-phosphate GlcNAc-1-phosphate transferase
MVAVLAFLVSVALLPGAIFLLRALRCVDVPNVRSSHREPTPRGGGVALVVGGIAAILFAGEVPLDEGWPFLALVVVYGCVGLWDDIRRGVSAVIRLVICAVAASVLVFPAVVQQEGKSLLYGALAVTFIVAFTNGYNFMDGINGISAIHLVVYGSILAYLGARPSGRVSHDIGLALLGCGLAFLPFNAISPRIFMGDAGSYAGGAAGSFAAVGVVAGGENVLAVLPVFFPYIVDTAFTVFRRARRREPWWEAHSEHAYQKLVRAGMSHGAVAVTVGMASLVCGLLGIETLRAGPLGQLMWVSVAVAIASAYGIVPHTRVADRWVKVFVGR